MIRRGFWLAAGVVLGVTGYRRVTRFASGLIVPRTPGMQSLPGTSGAAGRQVLAPTARQTPRATRIVTAARFVQDVRDGMAEYRDLHREEPDPVQRSRTLEG